MATSNDEDSIINFEELNIGLKLLPYIRARLHDWERKSTKLEMLVTGKTGTGKSTLINSIIGREVTKEGDNLDPQTTEVTPFTLTEAGISVKVFDTPGLQDGTKNEATYLANIKANCNDIDLIVYCLRMSEDKFTADCPDVRAMKLLTETLGEDIWKNSIFLLTFANDVVYEAELEAGDDQIEQQKYFAKQLEDWESLLRERLRTNVGLCREIVEGIVITPAGHVNEPTLPDAGSLAGKSHWLSRIWLKALSATKPSAQLALIKLNLYRIRTKEEEYKNDGDVEGQILNQHRLIFEKRGSDLGKELGVPSGELVGKVAGLCNGLSSYIDSLVFHLALKNGFLSSIDLTSGGDDDEPKKG